jgi:hypothetical protein
VTITVTAASEAATAALIRARPLGLDVPIAIAGAAVVVGVLIAAVVLRYPVLHGVPMPGMMVGVARGARGNRRGKPEDEQRDSGGRQRSDVISRHDRPFF